MDHPSTPRPRRPATRPPADASRIARLGQVVDPVCRMAFAPERAATSVLHAGRTIYFCSPACAEQFAEDPDYFAGLTTPSPGGRG